MTWLAILIFWAYTLLSCKFGGIPYCLSDTYYSLRKFGWLFTVFQIAMSLFVATLIRDGWLGYILAVCIAGVGAVPNFRKGWQHTAHYAFTILAMLGITTLWIAKGYWWMPLLVILASLRRNWLLGIEIGFYTLGFIYMLLFPSR